MAAALRSARLIVALRQHRALFGVALGAGAGDEPGTAVLGLLFGVGAVVVMPIVYGLLGFVSALVGAALYNLVARVTGGIELELE
jgi:hypothetical protein